MLVLHRTTALLLLGSSLVGAQVVIENPKHLEVSEQQVQAVFLTTVRVVEKEFHSQSALENTFRLRLVLGEKPERFTIDDPSGNGTVYMERWSEGKFAVTAMRLSIQHLLFPERQKRMLEEIARRTHEIAPVTASQLREEGVPSVISESHDNCVRTMTNAAVHSVNCRPVTIMGRP
jgi:hypothetical protein